jgi:hypothetical protein
MKENKTKDVIDCDGFYVEEEENCVLIIRAGIVEKKELLSDIIRFYVSNNPKYHTVDYDGKEKDIMVKQVGSYRLF